MKTFKSAAAGIHTCNTNVIIHDMIRQDGHHLITYLWDTSGLAVGKRAKTTNIDLKWLLASSIKLLHTHTHTPSGLTGEAGGRAEASVGRPLPTTCSHTADGTESDFSVVWAAVNYVQYLLLLITWILPISLLIIFSFSQARRYVTMLEVPSTNVLSENHQHAPILLTSISKYEGPLLQCDDSLWYLRATATKVSCTNILQLLKQRQSGTPSTI